MQPLDFVKQITTAEKAVTAAFALSPHTNESMGSEIRKPRETVGRFCNSNGGLSFPEFVAFVDALDNDLLIQWMAYRRGYALAPLDKNAQRREELIAELAKLETMVDG